MKNIWVWAKPFAAAVAFYFGVRFVVEESVQNVARSAICAFVTEGAKKAEEAGSAVVYNKGKNKK